MKKYTALIALTALIVTGCSSNYDLSLACVGSKDVMTVVDKGFVERAVPLTISLRTERQNKMSVFSHPIYKVVIDNTTYDPKDVYLFDNKLSGAQSTEYVANSFRFELDTRVLTLVEKSTLTIGRESYSLMNTFTGKCS
jgi:uncharacterized protein YcfL